MLTEKEERFLRRTRKGQKYFLALAVVALGAGALYMNWAFKQMGSDEPCVQERWFDPAGRVACSFSARFRTAYTNVRPQTPLEKSLLEALKGSRKIADAFEVLVFRLLLAGPVLMFGEHMLMSAVAPRPYLKIIDKLQGALPAHLRRSVIE